MTIGGGGRPENFRPFSFFFVAGLWRVSTGSDETQRAGYTYAMIQMGEFRYLVAIRGVRKARAAGSLLARPPDRAPMEKRRAVRSV